MWCDDKELERGNRFVDHLQSIDAPNARTIFGVKNYEAAGHQSVFG